MSITEESTQRVYKCLFCYFNLSEVFRIKKKMRKIDGRAQGAFWGSVSRPASKREWVTRALQLAAPQSGHVSRSVYTLLVNQNAQELCWGDLWLGPSRTRCQVFSCLCSLSSRILPGNQTLALASHLFCTSDSEFHIQNVMGSCREVEQSGEQAQGAWLAKGLILVVLGGLEFLLDWTEGFFFFFKKYCYF